MKAHQFPNDGYVVGNLNEELFDWFLEEDAEDLNLIDVDRIDAWDLQTSIHGLITMRDDLKEMSSGEFYYYKRKLLYRIKENFYIEYLEFAYDTGYLKERYVPDKVYCPCCGTYH